MLRESTTAPEEPKRVASWGRSASPRLTTGPHETRQNGQRGTRTDAPPGLLPYVWAMTVTAETGVGPVVAFPIPKSCVMSSRRFPDESW